MEPIPAHVCFRIVYRYIYIYMCVCVMMEMPTGDYVTDVNSMSLPKLLIITQAVFDWHFPKIATANKLLVFQVKARHTLHSPRQIILRVSINFLPIGGYKSVHPDCQLYSPAHQPSSYMVQFGWDILVCRATTGHDDLSLGY